MKYKRPALDWIGRYQLDNPYMLLHCPTRTCLKHKRNIHHYLRHYYNIQLYKQYIELLVTVVLPWIILVYLNFRIYLAVTDKSVR